MGPLLAGHWGPDCSCIGLGGGQWAPGALWWQCEESASAPPPTSLGPLAPHPPPPPENGLVSVGAWKGFLKGDLVWKGLSCGPLNTRLPLPSAAADSSRGPMVMLSPTEDHRRLPLLTAPGPTPCGCFPEAPSGISHQRSATHKTRRPEGHAWPCLLLVPEQTCSVNNLESKCMDR